LAKLIQKETDVNLGLTINRCGVGEPLTLSGGGEFRRESFTATAGDFQSYGAGPTPSNPLLYADCSWRLCGHRHIRPWQVLRNFGRSLLRISELGDEQALLFEPVEVRADVLDGVYA